MEGEHRAFMKHLVDHTSPRYELILYLIDQFSSVQMALYAVFMRICNKLLLLGSSSLVNYSLVLTNAMAIAAMPTISSAQEEESRGDDSIPFIFLLIA
mmetsp:Transcript_56868/g.169749  ORF Transcript_56868/g.169749 Transcript_56868/m.169749 type:complete len:98 (+) Transcript_56868:114-407(+)